MSPLLLGVPVRPTTLLASGRTFMNDLNRFDCQDLKLDSSSTTTMSNPNGMPLLSTSQVRFSLLMI
jgi:hypothetical protein